MIFIKLKISIMFNRITITAIASVILLSCVGNNSGKRNSDNGDNNKSQLNLEELKNVETGEMLLLVGTYTSKEGSKGVYVYRFNTETGNSDSVSMVEAENPSYLALSPRHDYVYAVSEGQNGGVYSFSLDKSSGTLTPINFQSTLESSPCYITINQTGKNIHTANYGGGSITSFQVNHDGSLTPAKSVISFEGSGPDSTRQESPHLHIVMFTYKQDYLFAADLGSDKLYRFSTSNSPFEGQPNIDKRSLKEFEMPPRTGPRHFAFHPNGDKYLYVLGELSGEILVYDYENGEISHKQTVVADSVGARGSADIHISPNGRYLYASNRLQADGIAIFSINSNDGTLTKVGYQHTARHPRNFVITHNGKYLLVACRDDNKIQVFQLNSETGMLTNINKDIQVNMPVCLKLAAINNYGLSEADIYE